jgi:hypothetical protein
VREEAFWHLERMRFSAALGQGLAEALRRTTGDHRQRVLKLIERSHDRRFVPHLLRLLDTDRLGPTEVVEIARVVSRLEGRQGLRRWEPALTPRGRFFRRRLPGTALEQTAAAAAVAEVPGEDAARLLRLTLSAADRKVRPWIESLLQHRAAHARLRFAS